MQTQTMTKTPWSTSRLCALASALSWLCVPRGRGREGQWVVVGFFCGGMVDSDVTHRHAI